MKKSKLKARIEHLEKGLRVLRDYPPEGSERRTEDGYPAEVVYDEFAYKRMIDSFREGCAAILGE